VKSLRCEFVTNSISVMGGKKTCGVRDWAIPACVIKFVRVTHDFDGVSYWMDVLPKLSAISISLLFNCVFPLCMCVFPLTQSQHFIYTKLSINCCCWAIERNIKKGQLVGW